MIIATLLAGNAARGAPAGELDTTFAGSGKQMIAFGPDNFAKAYTLAQAPDGALYLVGDAPFEGNASIGVAAFDFDGYPRENGGVGNWLVSYTPPGASYVSMNAAAAQPDGKLVVVGGATIDLVSAPIVCRFEADLAVDTSFGDGGCVLLPLSGTGFGHANAVIVQTDGKIAIAGQYDFDQPIHAQAFIGQLDSEGHPTEFDGDGVVFGPPAAEGQDTAFSAIAQAPDGGLVAAGYFGLAANDRNFLVMKVDQTGAPVGAFNNLGFRIFAFDEGGVSFKDEAKAVAVFADGAILIAGDIDTGAAPRRGLGLLKLTSQGQLYPQFPPRVLDPCGATCEISTRAMKISYDGRILVAGLYSDDLTHKARDFFVWRLLPNGAQDSSFGQGMADYDGLAWLGFDLENNHSQDVATGLVLQGDRVVAGGYCKVPGNLNTYNFCMARLDHGLDISFEVTPIAGPHGSISPDGVTVVGHSDYALFSMIPDPGYRVLSATGCGGSLNGAMYVAGPVIEDCAVSVTFGPLSIFSDGFED